MRYQSDTYIKRINYKHIQSARLQKVERDFEISELLLNIRNIRDGQFSQFIIQCKKRGDDQYIIKSAYQNLLNYRLRDSQGHSMSSDVKKVFRYNRMVEHCIYVWAHMICQLIRAKYEARLPFILNSFQFLPSPHTLLSLTVENWIFKSVSK